MNEIKCESSGAGELLALMKSGRVPHGVILESKQQEITAKYALLLSKWAVCRETENKPCGKCSGCLKAESGNHSDIYTAQGSGKSNTVSVDEIRNICKNAYVIPNEANNKVFILPNADLMQAPAQNAFLKVLEEPPQNIIFILCCSSARKLLGTIRSRAVVFKLDSDNAVREDNRLFFEQAEKIALALTDSKGYTLLAEIGKLTDRSRASIVLELLSDILREAAVNKACGKKDGSEAVLLLQRKIKTKNLLDIVEVINTAQTMLEQNINMNLFSAWLCSAFRRKK